MFDCFKKKKVKVDYPEPEITTPYEPSKATYVVGLVIGHNKVSQGARNYLGESEYSFYKRIAKQVQLKATDIGVGTVILERPSGVDYQRQCEAVRHNAIMAQVSHTIHLHFNSASVRATGCEVLIDDTPMNQDYKIADYFTDQLNEKFGFRERGDDGVKTVKSGHAGHGMLSTMSGAGITSVLIEPCFAHYRNKESALIFENDRALVDLLVDVCHKIQGGFFMDE